MAIGEYYVQENTDVRVVPQNSRLAVHQLHRQTNAWDAASSAMTPKTFCKTCGRPLIRQQALKEEEFPLENHNSSACAMVSDRLLANGSPLQIQRVVFLSAALMGCKGKNLWVNASIARSSARV
jgi:formate dehydrogenase assembly factor FdhD